MTQHEHPFHYYRSPSEIREVQFSHRVRGVDEYEVAEYLDLLADQVHATDLELARLREERDRLRQENEKLRSEVARVPDYPAPSRAPAEVTPQAAALLLNAQRVADDLVEEAVRRTRDMLTVARAEKNAILRNAQEAAAAMLVEARDASPGVPISPRDNPPGSHPSHQDSYTSHQDSYVQARDSYATKREPSPAARHIAPQRTWQLDGQAAV